MGGQDIFISINIGANNKTSPLAQLTEKIVSTVESLHSVSQATGTLKKSSSTTSDYYTIDDEEIVNIADQTIKHSTPQVNVQKTDITNPYRK